MEIYKNGIMTHRAFIMFSNIQHFSWDIDESDLFLAKIYSSGGKIVQLMTKEDFDRFKRAYWKYMDLRC